MIDPLLSGRDLRFCLFDWLKLGDRADAEAIEALLNLSKKLAQSHFLPHYKTSDIIEPKLDADGNVRLIPEIGEALEKYGELGLFAASFPEELGGMDLPFLASAASFSYFAAANIATAAYPMLTTANARLIVEFGSQAQIKHFALPQIEGRWFGTMCLSETQAGSSLADIQTRADPVGEDALGQLYRLRGNKMWISGGDQDVSENIVHLVLAKVPSDDGKLPEGTQGLSLFLVPKTLPDGERNDVCVAGLNHKMGYRGTANCVLNFGESEGASGWLVGNVGDGLRQMFMMMNEARISVGMGAAALACRSHRLSVQYAQERLQGRKPGARSGPPVAIIEHTDVRHMLLSQKAYAEGALALCLYCADLSDRKDEEAAASLLGLLTPIAKTWPSEFGLAANDLAIQIHGGYGYSREFDVEQLYRDNRLNPIHEGTTGIQAMDLLARKILRDGSALPILANTMADTIARSRALQGGSCDLAERLETAWQEINFAIGTLREGPPDRACDNATSFLRAFGHGVLGWLWLDQATAASSLANNGESEAIFAEGKARTCRHFFETELPRVRAWLEPVSCKSDAAANAPHSIF